MPRRPRSRGGNRGRAFCLLAAAALDWRLLRGAAPFAAPPSAGRAGAPMRLCCGRRGERNGALPRHFCGRVGVGWCGHVARGKDRAMPKRSLKFTDRWMMLL